MLRILFIVPYVPSPIRFRSYNFVRSLASLGHEVAVLTAVSGADDATGVAQLRDAGINVASEPMPVWRSMANCIRTLPTGTPLQAVYSWNPALARRAADLFFGNRGGKAAPAFDVVHVEHLRGSRYGLHLIAEGKRRGRNVPVVWDSVDCISLLFRQASVQGRQLFSRLVTGLELKRTEKFEGFLLEQYRQIVITSPVDRKALLDLLPAGSSASPAVTVIPIGVDVEYFRPDPSRTRDPATLVVSGKMSYHANVAMVSRLVEEIMPKIWARQPEVKVVVVGKDPPPAITAFARDPRIQVTGTVDDMRPFLGSATIAVAPAVYGVGMQSKVLEAMACQTPVVVAPKAARALAGDPRESLVLAEDSADFADAVLALLADAARRDALGRAGLEYVQEHYPWSRIAASLADVYETAVRECGPEKL